MSRFTRTVVALAASAVIAGACGSSGTTAPAATTAATAATAAPAAAAVNSDVQGFKFPANTDVAKGTKVTWTNKDSVDHTVTSGTRPNKDGKFDLSLAGGSTVSFTFSEAGTFNYWCQVHSTMNGTITVK